MLITLLILIFIRPFISSLAFPYTNSIYSTLLLSVLAIWIIAKRAYLNEIKTIRYPLLLFILALFISLIFSQHKIISMRELYKYITGLSLLLVAASLAHKERERIIFCITASGLLISILAIYQYFFGFQRLLGYITKQGITEPFILDYLSRKRVFFPFVTPNSLAGYLILIMPLTLIVKDKKKWLILTILFFALLLTQSLGAFLSIFSASIIYCYLEGKFKKKGVIFLLGLFVIMGLVFMARATTQKQHIQPIFSTTMRLSYWKDTWGIIKAHPLLGMGLGNFNLAQSRYAHNSYLQLWAEMGILGIISILWLIIAAFKSTINNINNYPVRNQIICLLTANITFLIHNFVDFTFFLPEVALIWWVLLGLILP